MTRTTNQTIEALETRMTRIHASVTRQINRRFDGQITREQAQRNLDRLAAFTRAIQR